MNIVITLPGSLIDEICDGRKVAEMRKSAPRHLRVGSDGFFCVEKGTRHVRCWCRVDKILKSSEPLDVCFYYAGKLGVSSEYIKEYMANKKQVYLWHIGKVKEFLPHAVILDDLLVDRAPQQFVYAPLSHGESY